MMDSADQVEYWDTVGATKTFTHPINFNWLTDVHLDAQILDFGCGYGRVMAELSDHGFTDLAGVDVSSALISRARQLRPDLRFSVLGSAPELDYPPDSFDVVLLFAVLTCVPDGSSQRALIAELGRVLAPGGLLYISDFVLQDDERNQARYAARAGSSNSPFGVFKTHDGAVLRHHDIGHLRALFSDFELVRESHIDVTTMNGHQARAVQLLARC